MVKSGLIDNVSVSHYRLSIHLSVAFLILSLLFWILLNYFNKSEKKILQFNNQYISIKILLVLIFLQIIIGAFVSGLDAGKIYQTWPLMNESYFPNDVDFNNFLNFNNASFVQFFHRNTAYLIFFLTIYLGFNIFKKKAKNLYIIFLFFSLAILVQIVLGISVLLSGADIYFASMHQISSIFLIASALKLYHSSIRS